MKAGKLRGAYKACEERNRQVVKLITSLKSEHPYWGYRRIWANLKHFYEVNISPNTVYALMSKHGLLSKKYSKNKALRVIKSKPQADRPNQYWGIDMTKVLTPTGWVYVTVVLDWFSKKVVGYHIGLQSKACDWLSALDMALNRQFPDGAREKGLSLVSDNGCQPTSVSFMKSCGTLGIKQIFTSFCNPKGNAETERFMRTLKEECAWLVEWKNALELTEALEKWFEKYNQSYLHSKLGYITPANAELIWNNFNFKTLNFAA